ncbi:hypothetical protein DSO57_1007454 [Entomophthora muscae]|uniref:Uncharacterized protein n=1 Tax=Entomophthora muscae TaxID=34485 RepID=A0ACC2U5N6_9FUNG|nr:hypothetical protein DSO57_1007454 [Entomophthora muscae]
MDSVKTNKQKLTLGFGAVVSLGLAYFAMQGAPGSTMDVKRNDPQLKSCPVLDKELFQYTTETTLTNTPKVEVSPYIKSVIQDMIDLYECHPTEKAFEIYDLVAEFEDPICYAQGSNEIKVQFYGMAKVFPRCKIVRSHIFSIEEVPYPFPESCQIDRSRPTPDTTPRIERRLGASLSKRKGPRTQRVALQIRMELWQLYRIGTSDVPMKSLVTLDLDPVSGKIIRHQDYWNYEDSWRQKGGIVGAIWNFLRRANGKYLGYVVSLPRFSAQNLKAKVGAASQMAAAQEKPQGSEERCSVTASSCKSNPLDETAGIRT